MGKKDKDQDGSGLKIEVTEPPKDEKPKGGLFIEVVPKKGGGGK